MCQRRVRQQINIGGDGDALGSRLGAVCATGGVEGVTGEEIRGVEAFLVCNGGSRGGAKLAIASPQFIKFVFYTYS
jgi:hypothetical protein